MAAASISITLECSICCENFKIPKVLQCGHTFCMTCIERYIGDRTETVPCPICQQNIKIPEGGAKMFSTNFILQTSTQGVKISTPRSHVSNVAGTPTSHTAKVLAQSFSPINHDCPYHERPVDYYCISCHSLICHKCFVKDHQGHEYLDVDCETTKERAKEFVSSSEKFIQNKIKELEETHTNFVEASKKLLSYTEDACRRITQQTEKIIEDIKTSSETVMLDIRNKMEESECILTKARENIMEQIKNIKLDLETNLPSLSEDSCIQILASVPKIKELEKLCESMKENPPVLYKYMDWEERDFSLDIGMLGSVVTKSYYLNKPICFRFIFDIDKISTNKSYSEDKFRSNGTEMELCCSAWNNLENLCKGRGKKMKTKSHFHVANYVNKYISIELLNANNPGQDYCIFDGQLSLLNIDDDSKTLSTSFINQELTTGGSSWVWSEAIPWNDLIGKNNGYLTSNNQFIVYCEITQIRENSLK